MRLTVRFLGLDVLDVELTTEQSEEERETGLPFGITATSLERCPEEDE